MDDTDHMDYEAEEVRFRNYILKNQRTLQRVLDTNKMEVSEGYRQHHTAIADLKEKLEKAKKRVEEVKKEICRREAEGCQAKEEVEKMMREMEKAALTVQGEKEELERQKEILAEYTKEQKEKELWAAETNKRNQGKVSLAESSVDLFMSHLGLEITCSHHNTFIFKFTQVSRSNPESEYLLEVGLEGDKYSLKDSAPPLPCLAQLQEQLEASGNLSACLAQVRKLYQRGEKRPLE